MPKESSNFERVPANITARQKSYIEREARRKEISFSDQLRRMLDAYIDVMEGRLLFQPADRPPLIDPPPTDPSIA